MSSESILPELVSEIREGYSSFLFLFRRERERETKMSTSIIIINNDEPRDILLHDYLYERRLRWRFEIILSFRFVIFHIYILPLPTYF